MKIAFLVASGIFLAALATTAVTVPAQALTMKECSAKYKEAKAAGTLNGMKWNDFRKSQCGAEATAAPAAATPPAAETRPAAETEAGGDRSEAGIGRASGDVRSRTRLRQGMEGRQGSGKESRPA